MRVNPQAVFAAVVASKAGITTGQADSFTGRNSTGRDLYITRWRVRAFYDGTQTDIDGTPLTNTSSSSADNTKGAPCSLVTINVKIGTDSWFTAEVSLATIFDDHTNWAKFEEVWPKLGTDQEISVSYTNSSGKTVKLRALFEGVAVPNGQPPVVA